MPIGTASPWIGTSSGGEEGPGLPRLAGVSRSSLMEQLRFEGFTQSQARYGVSVGTDIPSVRAPPFPSRTRPTVSDEGTHRPLAIRRRKLRQLSYIPFLTGECADRRVADAPRTERLRLMALRVAAVSAAVSREAGRGRHRLGAFSLRKLASPQSGR